MYNVACPSCGAPVSFRSAASVMAVCGYCRTTLLKDADAVKDIGKMSSVLEDYSPLQIGTTGVYEQRRFTLVGRIQLRYESGLWNEWYALFDDGTGGWLSDASGQMVFTIGAGAVTDAPPFDGIRPGSRFVHGGRVHLAADIRTARCTGGEGELPFRVGDGWQARVADFRCVDRFLTLDYSEPGEPQIFLGASVTTDSLKCQLLRTDEQVAGTTGRYRGRTSALDCPSCGAGITHATGMAVHAVCPSCHAQIDFSTDRALVLRKGEELAQVKTSLDLGSTATIDGGHFTVIGFLRRKADGDDDDESWFEYLLFDPRSGFLWLVETGDDQWDRVNVLNVWPEPTSANAVRHDGRAWLLREACDAEVTYAAGAFNWRVAVRDRHRIAEYAAGGSVLTLETDEHEATWSAARRVSREAVMTWFGVKPSVRTAAVADAKDDAQVGYKVIATIASVALVILNLPWVFVDEDAMIWPVAALVMLWVPVKVAAHFAEPR